MCARDQHLVRHQELLVPDEYVRSVTTTSVDKRAILET
jgi:hypothetical protein